MHTLGCSHCLSLPLTASHCRFLVTPIPACCVLLRRASPLRTSCMDQTELGWLAVRYHLLFTAVLPAHLVPFPLLCLSWDPHPLLQWHYRDWFPGKESFIFIFIAKETLASCSVSLFPHGDGSRLQVSYALPILFRLMFVRGDIKDASYVG